MNSEKIVIKNDFVNSIYTTITNNDEYSKLAETEKKNYLIIYLEKLF
ncbi:hypothetical protein HOG21_00750 [bacterium]|nr:hypothetical protein [bacterium]